MGAIETRDACRDSLFLFADMTIANAEGPRRVKLRNLSAGGMMAVCEEPVARGLEARFAVPRVGDVQGMLVWVDGRRMGVAFTQRIDPSLARQQVPGPDCEAPRYARAAVFPRACGTKHGERLSV